MPRPTDRLAFRATKAATGTKAMLSESDTRTIRILSDMAGLLALAIAGYSIVAFDIYRPIVPDHQLGGTLSQDIGTLVCTLALLVLPRLARREPKAWLIWAGFAGFLWYNYALYAFEAIYTILYPAYLALVALSFYALVLFALKVRPAALRHGPRPPPRRTAALVLLAIIAMIAPIWLSIMVPAIGDARAPEASSIFALDLGFVFPLMVVCAIALLRARPVGDLLAIPLLIKASSIGLSVLLGTLLQPLFGRPIAWADVPVYALLGIIPLAVAMPFWRRLTVATD